MIVRHWFLFHDFPSWFTTKTLFGGSCWSHLSVDCGLRTIMKVILRWTRPAYCGLLVQALAEAVERYCFFIVFRKLHPWKVPTYLFIYCFWQASGYPAADSGRWGLWPSKVLLGQRRCHVRTCGLFDCYLSSPNPAVSNIRMRLLDTDTWISYVSSNVVSSANSDCHSRCGCLLPHYSLSLVLLCQLCALGLSFLY